MVLSACASGRATHAWRVLDAGGRAWIKKWGLPAPSASQKRNRREQRRGEQAITALLKEAAAREPPPQPGAAGDLQHAPQ